MKFGRVYNNRRNTVMYAVVRTDDYGNTYQVQRWTAGERTVELVGSYTSNNVISDGIGPAIHSTPKPKQAAETYARSIAALDSEPGAIVAVK